MLAAALLAAGSALAGGALAHFARTRPALLARTRTFAFLAAAAVVALHLLPEVLQDLGLVALLFIAAGFALPGLFELLAHAVGPTVMRAQGLAAHRIPAEVGFLALLLHSLIEGLTLRAALQAPGDHGSLALAVVAHHVPLTAAVALPLIEQLGVRAAFVRVLAIAAAGAGGAVAAEFVPGLAGDAGAAGGVALQRATAVLAGALLHVVWDELRRKSPAGGQASGEAASGFRLQASGKTASRETASGFRLPASASDDTPPKP